MLCKFCFVRSSRALVFSGCLSAHPILVRLNNTHILWRSDPSAYVAFSDMLYNNAEFAEALANSLTDEGVLVAQVGEEDDLTNGGWNYSTKKFEHRLMEHLGGYGFETVKDFQEAHGGFLGVWRFIIAFKSETSQVNWYATQAEIDLKLKQRSMQTNDGSETPFRYFDGASMMVYQYPSRVSQEVFCRGQPTPPFCAEQQGLDPFVANLPASALEIKESKIPNGGRGVFFKEPAAKGAYLAAERMVDAIHLVPTTTWLIRHLMKKTDLPSFKLLEVYMFGYGYANDFYGETGYSVEPSILMFINHGCDRTYNIGMEMSVTEKTADPKKMPDELMNSESESYFYNPFADRNHWLRLHAFETPIRDVEAGEEMLDNYLSYLAMDNWESGLTDYRTQCEGQGVGAINRYEDKDGTSKE